MLKRFIIGSVVFIALYTGLIQFQVMFSRHTTKSAAVGEKKGPAHKVYNFSFSKFSASGEKEIEIEGDSADILAKTVDLMNVVAKAYAEEVPVTMTADEGNFDRGQNKVNLRKNVVATTENGTRLLTETLDILPSERVMETDAFAEVKKDNINVEGTGAQGNMKMKKVKFRKNVTVVVQDPNAPGKGPTTVTCDGPLIIDYEKNIAHFKTNVVAQDSRGKLSADLMDVYYNKVTRRVSKIVALGNVVIENPDGNKTYSDNVIYMADEGRIILGGDAEAIYVSGDLTDEGLLDGTTPDKTTQEVV